LLVVWAGIETVRRERKRAKTMERLTIRETPRVFGFSRL
jgi:hypothetical protein